MQRDADVIVIGSGLAGLVAASEVAAAGKRVIVLEQENETNLGGQAFWSWGLFFVDSPEQKRLRIRDSHELAWLDWMGAAGFDREEDRWPRRWAEAYVAFAAGEKRAWLVPSAIASFRSARWAARRGGASATGHRNSVPRFHITWGTGPASSSPSRASCGQAVSDGSRPEVPASRFDALRTTEASFDGVRGTLLEPSGAARGRRAARRDRRVQLGAEAVIIASGGIGGNHELRARELSPERLGDRRGAC